MSSKGIEVTINWEDLSESGRQKFLAHFDKGKVLDDIDVQINLDDKDQEEAEKDIEIPAESYDKWENFLSGKSDTRELATAPAIGNLHEEISMKWLKKVFHDKLGSRGNIRIGKWQVEKREADIVFAKYVTGSGAKILEWQTIGVPTIWVRCIVEIKAIITKQICDKAFEELNPSSLKGVKSCIIAFAAGNSSRNKKQSGNATILKWVNTLPRNTLAVFLFPSNLQPVGKGGIFLRPAAGIDFEYIAPEKPGHIAEAAITFINSTL